MTRRLPRALGALTLALALGFSAAGCATGSSPTGEAPTTAGDADGATAADQFTVEDAWVKSAESGMSAAFGILRNEGDEEIRIVSSTSDASPVMELHETVENTDGQMIMREKDGGFPIPAHSEYLLQPGANHLMLMDLTTPVLAGDVVEFAIEFDDGSVYTFTAPAKDFSGANETYVEE